MSDDVSEQVGTSVLFENDRIRVWDLTLQPGETSPRHRHRHDYVFVHVTPGTVEVHQAGEAPSVEECDAGYVEYTEVGPGVEHHLVNRGNAVLCEVLVEFKGPSRAAAPRPPETNGRSRTSAG
jgi:quercetin dioxygenase-like cupin family protein